MALLVDAGEQGFGEAQNDGDVGGVVVEDVGLEDVAVGGDVAGAENDGLMLLQPGDDGDVEAC